MKSINRRSFLLTATKGLGATVVLSQLPKSLLAQAIAHNIPIGFQTWTVREQLAKDFPGTLKSIAALGYQVTELCSPLGYSDPGFAQLAKMKTADLRRIIQDAGLTCPSCHFGLKEFSPENIDQRIEFAQQLGLQHMVCSGFFLPKPVTLKDYLSAADGFNKAAEKIKAAGLQAGYHNHNFEFEKLEDRLLYDALLERFDPDLVKLQFQTAVITLGYKAADYFTKFPARFISAHLSDWTKDKKEMPVGKGVIDWKEFFAAAKAAGVGLFFVEMDPETFPASASYIKSMPA